MLNRNYIYVYNYIYIFIYTILHISVLSFLMFSFFHDP